MIDKQSDLMGADAYPGETPQRQDERSELRRDYTDSSPQRPKTYMWATNGVHISLSDTYSHDHLLGMMNHNGDFSKPYAMGTVEVASAWKSLWSIGESNIAPHRLEKRLKRYCRDQGWQFQGLVDHEYQPLEGFKMISGLWDLPEEGARRGERWENRVPWSMDANGNIQIGKVGEFHMDIGEGALNRTIGRGYAAGAIYNMNVDDPASPNMFVIYEPAKDFTDEEMRQKVQQAAGVPLVDANNENGEYADSGWGMEGGEGWEAFAHKLSDYPGIGPNNPGVQDWQNKTEHGPWDQIDQVDYYGEQNPKDDDIPEGPRICSECGEVCPTYSDWRLHTERAHVNPERRPYGPPQPVIDLDKPFPADWNTLVMDKTVMRQSMWENQNDPRWEPGMWENMRRAVIVTTDGVVHIGDPGWHHADLAARDGFARYNNGGHLGVGFIDVERGGKVEMWSGKEYIPQIEQEYQQRYAAEDRETGILRNEDTAPTEEPGWEAFAKTADWVLDEKPDVDSGWNMGHEDSYPFLMWDDQWVVDDLPGEFHSSMDGVDDAGYQNDFNSDQVRGRIYEPNTPDPKWVIYTNRTGQTVDQIKQQVIALFKEKYGITIASGSNMESADDDWAAFDEPEAEPQAERCPNCWAPRLEYDANGDCLNCGKPPKPQAPMQSQQLFSAARNILPGPMPFIFDIEKDRVYVGHPGERHSDIPGRFTPGGIVEGLFLPDGKVQLKTDTDMPYSVRHLVELWYYMHPELEVKQVFLMSGGKKIKLASTNIGWKVRNLAATDTAAWDVFKTLEPYGTVYAVGGIVRDVTLDKIPKDVDLLVQGLDGHVVESLLSALPGTLKQTGDAFGVFRYRAPDGSECEVALPRTEISTGGGHKDFDVQTNPFLSVEEDLGRRDFTGNSMAVNLSTGELIDPYQGGEHLRAGELKLVNEAAFIDDPLRILRALSAVSRHQLTPDAELRHSMTDQAHRLKELPAERIQMELDKILEGDDPEMAIRLMRDTGVLTWVLPEVAATVGFDQKSKYHRLHLDEHTMEVLRGVAEQTEDKDVRMAALMHDIGKVPAQWFDEEGYGHYYKQDNPNKPHYGLGADHAELGAEMTAKRMRELKFPEARTKRVEHLVRHHMFGPFEGMKGARKFVQRVGPEHAMDLLKLRRADGEGKGSNEFENRVPVDMQEQLVNAVEAAGEPTNVAQLAIGGDDLIAEGLKPGPQFKSILERLLNMVIENPALNNKETLVPLALSMANDRTANILDPVNEGLDPAVFENPEGVSPVLKPKIAMWVTKHIHRVMIENNWPDPTKHDYLRLILTGSLTTYQWSANSDFDVSLWIDTERLPDWVRADLVKIMIHHMDSTIVPGTTHPIQCFVVDPSKFTIEQMYKPGLRSAYDLGEQRWLVLPERSRTIDLTKEFPALLNYAKMVADKMKLMLQYDPPGAKVMWHEIHGKRRRDQQAGKGDYAESNVIYKYLANTGLFPAIAETTGEYIAKVSTRNWWEDPERDVWQHGMCDTYARAMIATYPHLQMGVAGDETDDGWNPQHYFAHDDNYAYDSIGRHPLPYHGVDNQMDVCELDQNPDEWCGPYGDNGDREDYKAAMDLIPGQHPWLSQEPGEYIAKTSAGQVMYHAAPVGKREQIAQEGLRALPSKWRGARPGVYLWQSEANARGMGGGCNDIYAVDVSGLPVEEDTAKDVQYAWGPDFKSYYLGQDVPTDRITHLDTVHSTDPNECLHSAAAQ